VRRVGDEMSVDGCLVRCFDEERGAAHPPGGKRIGR
jgi:hypothetical protein